MRGPRKTPGAGAGTIEMWTGRFAHRFARRLTDSRKTLFARRGLGSFLWKKAFAKPSFAVRQAVSVRNYLPSSLAIRASRSLTQAESASAVAFALSAASFIASNSSR